jgi:hypothetical protein
MTARVGVLLACCAVLLCAEALRVAPGNAPDEAAHVEYVLRLAADRALPVWNWPAQPRSYESFQPPLFYAGAAFVLGRVRALPSRGRFAALRLFSGLLQLGALVFLWALGRRLDGGDGFEVLCAAAAVPMFLFIGATVTNDAAANLAGAVLLWRAASLSRPAGPRAAVLSGAAAGLALLCKTTVLPVVAVSLAVLIDLRRGRRTASILRLAAAAGAALPLCGWFYWRNVRLYGDPFGVSRIAAYDRDRYAWSELGRWLVRFFQSFWGRFGSMTQPMPRWAYGLALLASAAAVGGWLKDGRRLWALPQRPLLAAALLLTLAQNFWYGFFMSYQPQARYSFPAFAAWAILFRDGLFVWAAAWPEAARRRAAWGAVLAAAAMHVAAWVSL